jgi:hypothetical protein
VGDIMEVYEVLSFSGVHHVASYYHTLQNVPAITTKLLLLLSFSQHVLAPMGHLQVEYNITDGTSLTTLWKDN